MHLGQDPQEKEQMFKYYIVNVTSPRSEGFQWGSTKNLKTWNASENTQHPHFNPANRTDEIRTCFSIYKTRPPKAPSSFSGTFSLVSSTP